MTYGAAYTLISIRDRAAATAVPPMIKICCLFIIAIPNTAIVRQDRAAPQKKIEGGKITPSVSSFGRNEDIITGIEKYVTAIIIEIMIRKPEDTYNQVFPIFFSRKSLRIRPVIIAIMGKSGRI